VGRAPPCGHRNNFRPGSFRKHPVTYLKKSALARHVTQLTAQLGKLSDLQRLSEFFPCLVDMDVSLPVELGADHATAWDAHALSLPLSLRSMTLEVSAVKTVLNDGWSAYQDKSLVYRDEPVSPSTLPILNALFTALQARPHLQHLCLRGDPHPQYALNSVTLEGLSFGRIATLPNLRKLGLMKLHLGPDVPLDASDPDYERALQEAAERLANVWLQLPQLTEVECTTSRPPELQEMALLHLLQQPAARKLRWQKLPERIFDYLFESDMQVYSDEVTAMLPLLPRLTHFDTSSCYLTLSSFAFLPRAPALTSLFIRAPRNNRRRDPTGPHVAGKHLGCWDALLAALALDARSFPRLTHLELSHHFLPHERVSQLLALMPQLSSLVLDVTSLPSLECLLPLRTTLRYLKLQSDRSFEYRLGFDALAYGFRDRAEELGLQLKVCLYPEHLMCLSQFPQLTQLTVVDALVELSDKQRQTLLKFQPPSTALPALRTFTAVIGDFRICSALP
jgi:hypothetical protein